MTKQWLLIGFFISCLAFLPPAYAEDTSLAPLHVIRPILHADQEQAELCLEFDHGLDAVGNAARLAAALHLESEGKIIPVSSRNLSLGGNQLCLSSLEHRKDYRFFLAALRDAKGEKLSHPYSLSFTMPARRPSLVFVAEESRKGQHGGSSNGITRWRDNPILHSVNSAKIKVELYRITDPARMVEAWNQRLQTTLAPSESIYFARDNGALVWESELMLSPVPDKNTETKIDFAGKNLDDFPPGLYLIAASDADEMSVRDRPDKDEADKDNALIPTAAAWLLRSDLRLRALRDDKGITAIAETFDAPSAFKDIHVMVVDRGQKTLAEAQSDANGLAQLKTDKIADAQNLVGLSGKGDAAFLDLAPDAVPDPVPPPRLATLALDQSTYVPADTINLTLAARDLHKRPLSLAGSAVQLLRPDRSLYDSQTVTLDANGAVRLSFAAPVASGLWHLIWRQGDGSVLAEAGLRISPNPLSPSLSVTADRASLTAGGAVNLTIRSETSSKAPAPFIAGRIELAWVKPDRPFAVWKDYDFDDGRATDTAPNPVGYFVTDTNGIAHLPVVLPVADQTSPLRQAQFRVVADASAGARDPEPLILPVKSADIVLGVRPRASRGHFPENSLARFDVVALDGDGNRHAVDDLTYQIYEEGRSFEWYQSEGHWNYRPQQQRRRIGGGIFSSADNGQGLIEAPVTSGTYQLEITNADGTLLAREDFNAGWGSAGGEKEEFSTLDLKASPAVLQNNVQEKIAFTLKHAGLVTATIADDHIRTLLHAAYPAGSGSLVFTPAADWGSRVMVRIEAHENEGGDGEAGTITLSAAGDMPVASPHMPAKPAGAVKPDLSLNADLALHEVSRQLLASRQSWNSADSKPRVSGSRAVFAAPTPFFNAPALLADALRRRPFTTGDIARQLEILRLWRDTILSANLMPETELKARHNDLLMRLLARQTADGGFASIPGSEASDIASTAAALATLAPLSDALTRPVIEQATAWLRHRFENTWFGEEERPARAAAYAALAAAGKLDPASLHYFSDTSADKNLPPLSAAQVAYAFASIHDKAAANFWIEKAKSAAADKNDFTPDSLPILFANEFFTPGDTPALLENSSKYASTAPDAAADFLLALWRLQTRAGAWRIELGKEVKTVHGIFAASLTEKPTFLLRNPSADHPLYLSVAAAAKAPAGKSAGQRHIYNLDGGEAKNNLTRGATYLVMLEGAWAGEKDRLVVNDDPQPFLLPVTCAIEAPSGDGFLGWLAYKSPTPVEACEKSDAGLAILVTRGEKDADTWRAAYLAKASGNEHDKAAPFTVQELP
jgi:hypothetical protein